MCVYGHANWFHGYPDKMESSRYKYLLSGKRRSMNRPGVLLTSILPDEGMDILQEHVTLTFPKQTQQFSYGEIRDHIHDKTGLICLLSDRIDKGILIAGNRLKVVANYAVGYNNIDIEEATARHVAVTNTPGVLTETTADLSFALILGIARRIVEADCFARSGAFTGWAPKLMIGTDVHDKTLGLIGFGRIGQAVAKRASGFNMRVIYHDLAPVSRAIEDSLKASYCDLDMLLATADYISLHVSLTEKTHHLLSSQELKRMKPGTFLINVARGPVIDERALVHALREKQVAGCALDVYEFEPEISSELKSMKNTILVPHIGSATRETRAKMAEMVAQSVISVLIKGKCPMHIVNPEIYSSSAI
jgi:glyoxylate reductase